VAGVKLTAAVFPAVSIGKRLPLPRFSANSLAVIRIFVFKSGLAPCATRDATTASDARSPMAIYKGVSGYNDGYSTIEDWSNFPFGSAPFVSKI
jgi:hypothetical protein